MKLPPAKKKQAPSSNLEKGLPSFGNRLIYTTVFLFFSSCFFGVFFGFKTIIGLFDFVKILLAAILSAIVIQHLFFRSAFPMNNAERLAFSVFGLGPSLCALFFLLNFSIPVSSKTTSHKVLESYISSGSIYFKAEGLPCELYPELCNIYQFDDFNFKAGDTINVTFDKGIGGYYVLKNIDAFKSSTSLNTE